MNYRHIFHSGNFADVFKHLILCLCLEKLQEKENPFFVIDTHSGIGKYDLTSELANKTGEYKDGILKLLQVKNTHPFFSSYLKIVEQFNRLNPDQLKTYPGSPQIIKQFLRANDQAVFAELHPEDYILLKRNFAGNYKTTTLNQDGYALLKSHLPPAIKRGLILIDPPFEKGNGREDDFDQMIKYLREAYKRFATGIYLLWYPIVDKNTTRQFHQEIMNLGIKKTLIAEIIIDQNIKEGFKGCGMAIVNFPYQLDEKLKVALPLILEYLDKKSGITKLEIIS
ncbi:MAG: 23S rRNA (adenine(2030)-N(6))-methyltransferase RlmJ [Pseudomonadota bacterium]